MRERPDHRFRDHLVRLVPTDRDLDSRVSIVLTPRDLEILRAIDLHGYLTLELIDLAFFRSSRPGVRPSTHAAHRLQQLWLWDFVERIELPVARIIGGRRPYLYALSPHGLQALDSQPSSPEERRHRRRLDRTSELFVEHNLTIAAVWANVLALIRDRQITLGTWVPERELRARHLRVFDHHARRWLPFLPDGYFELHYASGRVQSCLLEVDLGTHAVQAIRRKLRAFELFLRTGLATEIWRRDDYEVLIVAPSEQRLQNLAAVARQVVAFDRQDAYLFSMKDDLNRLPRTDTEWRCLDGFTYGLFFRDISETPSYPDPLPPGSYAVPRTSPECCN